MSERDWAREKVEGSAVAPSLSPRQLAEVSILLKAERARARRVVRAVKQSSPDGIGYYQAYDDACQAYDDACDEILKRLK